MQHIHCYKLIKEDKFGIREICTECKKVFSTPKDKTGRIDNKKYLKEHIRDTSQPFGRTSKVFLKYYGAEAGYISKFK